MRKMFPEYRFTGAEHQSIAIRGSNSKTITESSTACTVKTKMSQ